MTDIGKQTSAKNSRKHGVFSHEPVVGDERLEDWEAHLVGMRRSLQPDGHYEEVLTRQAAENRWKRARLERWMTDVIQQQIEFASLNSRGALEEAYDAMPADEAYWLGFDAGAAAAAFESLTESRGSRRVEATASRGALRALEHAWDLDADPTWSGFDNEIDGSGDGPTVAQLHRCIDLVARHRGVPVTDVVAVARDDADTAALFQARRTEHDEHLRAMRMSQAYMLNERDAEKTMRYAATLDREFDRTVKHLEVAQRARSNNPSPLVRLEIEEA
jgi:hypothetical protein